MVAASSGLAGQRRLPPPPGESGVGTRPPTATAAALHVPPLHRHDRGDAEDGVARGGMAELLVGRAGSLGRRRHPDRGQHLALGERGGHHADEEIGGGDRPPALGAGDLERGAEGDEQGGEIRGRIGVGDAAADGAAIADRRVAYLRHRLGERRRSCARRTSEAASAA